MVVRGAGRVGQQIHIATTLCQWPGPVPWAGPGYLRQAQRPGTQGHTVTQFGPAKEAGPNFSEWHCNPVCQVTVPLGFGAHSNGWPRTNWNYRWPAPPWIWPHILIGNIEKIKI